MNFTTEIDIRFSDLDAYGHVNNAIFFTYLEIARFKLFRECFAELMKSDLSFLVVKADCHYQKSIDIYDQVLIDISTNKVGRSSFTLGYLMHDGKGNDFATGSTVMVCYDIQQGKTVALPPAMRVMFDG